MASSNPSSEPLPGGPSDNWIVAGTVLGLAVALAIVGGVLWFDEDPIEVAAIEPDKVEVSPSSAEENPVVELSNDDRPFQLIEDDGQTLWAAPTDGEPVDLVYLMPGAQLILSVRPMDLLSHAEGPKVLAALGPTGQRAVELVEQTTGVPFDRIERLLVGWQVGMDGRWRWSLVVQLSEPLRQEDIVARFPTVSQSTHAGNTYLIDVEHEYYLPSKENGRLLVVTPPGAIQGVIELEGFEPPLRRDMRALLASTDADRHATFLVAPNFLTSEGRALFAGRFFGLAGPVDWLLGDEFAAASLSVHWDTDFFVELRARPMLDTFPEQAARNLARRVAEFPQRVQEHVALLEPAVYGREVIARLPAMTRRLVEYTRNSFEDGDAVVRCYLPVAAGHNLLMAAELALAEPFGGTGRTASVETSPADQSVAERLGRRTSLRFARDSLERALAMLGEDLGIAFEIIGRDLQTEGITRNQSLSLDLSDRTGEEILVEILVQANPDKLSSGPADVRQKLVYVLGSPAPGEPETVLITTRAAVKARGEQLPGVFGLP